MSSLHQHEGPQTGCLHPGVELSLTGEFTGYIIFTGPEIGVSHPQLRIALDGPRVFGDAHEDQWFILECETGRLDIEYRKPVAANAFRPHLQG